MPFSERSLMSHREEFCRLAAGEVGLAALCRRFGISRTAGYKWLARFRAEGSSGLSDRSRRPKTSPSRTDAETEERILAVRRAHPVWGGRKIRRILEMDGAPVVPSASTVTEVLRRHGLLDGPGADEPRAILRFEHAAPNDLWQMDFKGQVGMANWRWHRAGCIR